MRAMLLAWQLDGGARSYGRFAWVGLPPHPWGRHQAEEDVRADRYPNHTYPAIVYVDDVALVGSYVV